MSIIMVIATSSIQIMRIITKRDYSIGRIIAAMADSYRSNRKSRVRVH